MLEGQIVDAKGYSKIIFQEDFCKQVKEGKTYIFENVRVKKDNFTKQLYINTAKTGTVIRPTEPHTDVLALAPRLTELLPHPFMLLVLSVIRRLRMRTSQI